MRKINVDTIYEIVLVNLDCEDCEAREVWSVNEFEYVDDLPIECADCHSENINITLNNK